MLAGRGIEMPGYYLPSMTGQKALRDIEGGRRFTFWTDANETWVPDKGIWRTADLSGASWAEVSFLYSRGSMDVGDFLYVQASTDGGVTWGPVNREHRHGDNHALAFKMSDPDYLPNIVAIHLGTNDLNSDIYAQLAPYREGGSFTDTKSGNLATLIDFLLKWHNGENGRHLEKILVSQIVPVTRPRRFRVMRPLNNRMKSTSEPSAFRTRV